jgi:hypothetical protein
MKKCSVVVMFISLIAVGRAQTSGEWFNQTATQKKYLIHQIAALQVYIGYLQKGYNIAKKGLNAISNIKDGHFSLDKDFFASLHNINPKVKQYGKVADIITLNMNIVRAYRRTMRDAGESKLFNSGEQSYMNAVFKKLIDRCTGLTDQLITVIAPGNLQMSDDERIKHIDSIYEEMRQSYVFANSFGGDARILSVQRRREEKDVNTIRNSYGNLP